MSIQLVLCLRYKNFVGAKVLVFAYGSGSNVCLHYDFMVFPHCELEPAV
jgi:hypothetical protein